MDKGLKELTELVKAIRNRCEIYLALQGKDIDHALYTLLEDLYEDAQTIVDQYCTEEE